jgi:hypothetical protein
VNYALSQLLMIISSIIGVVFVDALIISVFSEKYSEVAGAWSWEMVGSCGVKDC